MIQQLWSGVWLIYHKHNLLHNTFVHNGYPIILLDFIDPHFVIVFICRFRWSEQYMTYQYTNQTPIHLTTETGFRAVDIYICIVLASRMLILPSCIAFAKFYPCLPFSSWFCHFLPFLPNVPNICQTHCHMFACCTNCTGQLNSCLQCTHNTAKLITKCCYTTQTLV